MSYKGFSYIVSFSLTTLRYLKLPPITGLSHFKYLHIANHLSLNIKPGVLEMSLAGSDKEEQHLGFI